MRTGALFAQSPFGSRLGSRAQVRLPLRKSLGQGSSAAECPEGQIKDYTGACKPGMFSACPNEDGTWRLFWQNTGAYYGTAPNAFANGSNFPEGVVASLAAQRGQASLFCDEHPIPTETQTSTPETPMQQPPQTPDPIPVSIDIQVFTPGGTGPIPVQNYAPPPQAPEPEPEAPMVQAQAPVKTSGSELANIGIAAGLVAAGAFALSMLK